MSDLDINKNNNKDKKEKWWKKEIPPTISFIFLIVSTLMFFFMGVMFMKEYLKIWTEISNLEQQTFYIESNNTESIDLD